MHVDHRYLTGNRIVCFIVLTMFFMLGTTPCHALFGGKVKNFSAENVAIKADGTVVKTGKLYVTPDAVRMDGMPWGGSRDMPRMNLSMLVLKKQNQQYFYNHDKKLVFVSPVDEEGLKALSKAVGDSQSEKVVGKEKVSGYNCIKKEVVTTFEAMGKSYESKVTVWQSDRFDFPLRTRDDNGNVQEMRHIKTGKPSEKLFRPLTGYKQVDNMMAVMGMDFSEMGSDEEDLPQEEIQDVNPEKLAEGLEQLMGGKNANPEQVSQVKQAILNAVERTRQIHMDPGAADPMWKIIPKRSGDRVGNELKTPDFYDVTLGTQSTFQEVCDDYVKRLTAKGWHKGGGWIQDGQGFLKLATEGRELMISSADDPGMDGRFTCFYSLRLGRAPSKMSAPPQTAPTVAQTIQKSTPRIADKQPAVGLLFANSDFENGDLTNWTASGTAFLYQPTKGDNPTARRRNQPSNHQGEFWIGTYEKYQGADAQKPGQVQRDKPTGTLTSIPFQIEGERITFHIGGGKRPKSVYVALLVDDREVLKASGNNSESMKRHVWDVSSYQGKTARVLICDQCGTGWGHINADNFRYETK